MSHTPLTIRLSARRRNANADGKGHDERETRDLCRDAELEIVSLRTALSWAMDEIDVLAAKTTGFAYPQAMPMIGREDQDANYVAACRARRGGI